MGKAFSISIGPSRRAVCRGIGIGVWVGVGIVVGVWVGSAGCAQPTTKLANAMGDESITLDVGPTDDRYWIEFSATQAEMPRNQ